MIILSKKRILIIFFCVIVGIACYKTQNIISNNQKTIETVSFPVSNKVIVLDAGHGTPDERSRE